MIFTMKINTSFPTMDRVSDILVACIALAALALPGCNPNDQSSVPVYGRYLPRSVAHELNDSTIVYAVIEIPAGTATMQAVDSAKHISPLSDTPIDFLPFPGNYGFIAGCARTDTASGAIWPLPVLVMMPALEEGSVIPVNPIALMSLRTHGRSFPVIVAVPAQEDLRSIRARNFVDLITEYDAARSILQTWFLNYLGRETFEFVGWHDERHARRIISEWKIN
jgi:inorganic pyrophosphatase